MSNTLTNLIPDAYAALDVVSRELVGFIPAVARDPKADRVALNQTLRIEQAPANAAGDNVTPAMAFPTAAYQTIGNKTLTISKSRFFPFSWTGEEQMSMDKGPGFLTIQQDQIAQAIRAAINEMEVDIATAAYKGASRAYGTAASTPFASTLADPANVKKILDDNGAPPSDRSLVINTTAGAAMRTLAQLTKANEAGDTSLLRQGTLLDIHGFAIRESAQVQSVTKGVGTGYVFNGTHAVGLTTLTMKNGSGALNAGDVVTFQNDTNKYVLATAALTGATTIYINAPGLLKQHTDSETMTVGGDFTANVGFSRNAVLLATRLPALPKEGDLATDRTEITDPRTGITLELAVYPGYRMNTYQILLAWGVSVIKPEHVAILLG
jgi:hypothetical protein